MGEYLLDTSALRGLPRAKLEAARVARHRLLLSPISVWELVCHLDETEFQRAKANALKAELCDMLEDPLAEIAADLCCPQAACPTRFEDRQAVPPMLAALRASDTYEEYMKKAVVACGQTRVVGNIAINAEAALTEEQAEFQKRLTNYCTVLVERYGRKAVIHLGGEQFCREATRDFRQLFGYIFEWYVRTLIGQFTIQEGPLVKTFFPRTRIGDKQEACDGLSRPWIDQDCRR